MNIRNTIIQHYKKYFDLHAKGIALDEDDYSDIDWAESLVKDCFMPAKAMEIKEFTFEGFIKNDWSDDFRTLKLIDGEKEVDLVKKFRAIFDLFESEVSVNYFLSDEKKTESEILEKWLGNLYGAITAEYETNSYYYSSHTYGTDYDTYLKIGGHDLFDELGGENSGKWCILKINVKCV